MTEGFRPAAVILAAGFSSRFTGFKPLAEVAEGVSALRAVAALYASFGILVTAVTGHRADDVAAEARNLGVGTVHNALYAQGMASSVRAGIDAVSSGCTHVFVHPVDMPLIRSVTVAMLLQAAQAGNDDAWIPAFCGHGGHPLLLAAKSLETVRRLLPTLPMDQALGRLQCRTVDVPDRFCLRDMDTQADFTAVREDWGKRAWLNDDESMELLRISGVPERVAAHSRAVACVARALAERLNAAGARPCLNPDAASCGGWLHDICKGEPAHAARGAACLRSLGLPDVASMIEHHSDLTLAGEMPLTEREVVYLADKYVMADRPVELKARFAAKAAVFADRPEALRHVWRRFANARSIERRMEKALGISPEIVAFQALTSIQGRESCES